MKITMRAAVTTVALTLVLAACGGRGEGSAEKGYTDPGITDTTIKLGGSAPLSGPAAAYSATATAAAAYFEHINESEGGVMMGDGKRRKVEYTILDDSYEPARSLANAKQLVQEDNVFALFNMVGTAPAVATSPYIQEAEVPSVFVASGSSVVGESDNDWMIGLQPTGQGEGGVLGTYVAQEHPGATVAVLYQNDDLGKDLLEGFKTAAEKGGAKLVAEESYEVTDPTVDVQMRNLARSKADIFFSAATPKAGAQAIVAKKQLGWAPVQINANINSGIGNTLSVAGLDESKGIISAAFWKSPGDDDADVAEFKKFAAESGERFDLDNDQVLDGWARGQAMVALLERLEEPTRSGLRELMNDLGDGYTIPLLREGITIRTAPGDRFPIEGMQLREFDGTAYKMIGSVIDLDAGAAAGS